MPDDGGRNRARIAPPTTTWPLTLSGADRRCVGRLDVLLGVGADRHRYPLENLWMDGYGGFDGDSRMAGGSRREQERTGDELESTHWLQRAEHVTHRI